MAKPQSESEMKVHWLFSAAQYVTPVLVTIILFFLTNLKGDLSNIKLELKSDIKELDAKMFTHLTNDEIHVPRGMIVNKGEFEIQCKFAEKERAEILNLLREKYKGK